MFPSPNHRQVSWKSCLYSAVTVLVLTYLSNSLQVNFTLLDASRTVITRGIDFLVAELLDTYLIIKSNPFAGLNTVDSLFLEIIF